MKTQKLKNFSRNTLFLLFILMAISTKLYATDNLLKVNEVILGAEAAYNMPQGDFGQFWDNGTGFFANAEFNIDDQFLVSIGSGFMKWEYLQNTEQTHYRFSNIPIKLSISNYNYTHSAKNFIFIKGEVSYNFMNTRIDAVITQQNNQIYSQRTYNPEEKFGLALSGGYNMGLNPSLSSRFEAKYQYYFREISISLIQINLGIYYHIDLKSDNYGE